MKKQIVSLSEESTLTLTLCVSLIGLTFLVGYNWRGAISANEVQDERITNVEKAANLQNENLEKRVDRISEKLTKTNELLTDILLEMSKKGR